jgi:hypothetical protein
MFPLRLLITIQVRKFFTRPDSDIKTVKDLAGKEVAVAKGSTYADTASKYTDKIKTYDSDITALQALSSGRHDAVITDFVTGKSAAKEGFKIKGKQLIERSEQRSSFHRITPEIFRGTIQSVDKGQMEAGRSLGMTKTLTLRRIILPQAFRRALPPLGNQFIIGLKDSSLAAFISMNELFNVATTLGSNNFDEMTYSLFCQKGEKTFCRISTNKEEI